MWAATEYMLHVRLLQSTRLEAEGLVMSKTKPSTPAGQSLERARLTKEVITAEGTKCYINNNEEMKEG